MKPRPVAMTPVLNGINLMPKLKMASFLKCTLYFDHQSAQPIPPRHPLRLILILTALSSCDSHHIALAPHLHTPPHWHGRCIVIATCENSCMCMDKKKFGCGRDKREVNVISVPPISFTTTNLFQCHHPGHHLVAGSSPVPTCTDIIRDTD